VRERVKDVLGAWPGRGEPRGATLLIYHRVGGGTADELDLAPSRFHAQVHQLAAADVLSLDAALDRLDAQDERPSFVLTFDDGFADIYQHAWPLLREHRLPFTLYLASGYMGQPMRWPGSTARGEPGTGLSWSQIAEMVDSGLCTVGNHTHDHVRPQALTVEQLDTCSDAVEQAVGVRPRHFTYPWGIPVPALEPAMRDRFRSASTGELGRNDAAIDRMRLRRVPVRRTDPDRFFAAKLRDGLLPERAYARIVTTAKRARRRG
jgi:peptidoglycan/xylan/chitin deacetylase (PgdA/CDA1 family)